jgi:glycerophosphoryl diester phosphodiesterase
MPLVIAHRGASGYLPEHTLPAKALAIGQGADYVEQDVVLTRDDVPIVLHDIHLDTTTDVAARFPGRQRVDGRYYAIDFVLDELRQLSVKERFHHQTGQPVFPQRFPAGLSRFSLNTLAEEIEFVRGVNQSLGASVGLYPEIKQPAFHRQQGKDITAIVLQTLREQGVWSAEAKCFVQCFDFDETRRCREEFGCPLPLIQLVTDKDWKGLLGLGQRIELDRTLGVVAEYADGIGPHLGLVVREFQKDGSYSASDLVSLAQRRGLKIHPWTLRRDDLPGAAPSLDRVTEILFREVGVDGVFSDFPDLTRRWIDEHLLG